VRIVPRPVDDQAVGTKLRREPPGFGARASGKSGSRLPLTTRAGTRLARMMAAVSALDRPTIARSAVIRSGSRRFCVDAALTKPWSTGLHVGKRLFQ